MTTYRVRMILLGEPEGLREVHDKAQETLNDLANEDTVTEHDFDAEVWGLSYEADVLIPDAQGWVQEVKDLQEKCAALGVLFGCRGLYRDHLGRLVVNPSFLVKQRRGPLYRFRPMVEIVYRKRKPRKTCTGDPDIRRVRNPKATDDATHWMLQMRRPARERRWIDVQYGTPCVNGCHQHFSQTVEHFFLEPFACLRMGRFFGHAGTPYQVEH